MAQVARLFARGASAVVTGGASEAFPDDPVVGRKKGVIPRATGAVVTAGATEIDRPLPTPLSTPAPEPAIEPDDPEPLIAVSDVLRKRRRARGFRSTILSGFAGGTGTGTGVGGGTRQTLGS